MALPIHRRALSRRTLLRGAGAAIALPWLDAMLPALTPAPLPQRRWIFVFAPNGKKLDDWTPASEALELPFILEPLAPHASHLLVLSGLALDGARPHNDGPGDHARAAAAFLTAAHPRKTGGADIYAGVSVDQLLAAAVGQATRLPSLELGVDPGQAAGNCDSGYSCAYTNNISWRTPTTPTGKETEPKAVFARLFGDPDALLGAEARAKASPRRRAVLDLVGDQAKRLRNQLGNPDRTKLDDYLDAVDAVDRQLRHEEQEVATAAVTVPPGLRQPTGDRRQRLRLLYDLMTLALRADLTRVVTLMLGNAGSSRSYPFLGIPQGHHDLSHHGGKPDKLEALRRINRYHVEELARFAAGAASVADGDGTLLDHLLLAYGSGISDGDRHNHDDLPILTLGGGSGAVRAGRHLRCAPQTPLANLWLTMLHQAGIEHASFGDSTGPLAL